MRPVRAVIFSCLVLILLTSASGTVQAQLERIDVPRGVLRVAVFSSLMSSDSRFNDGTTESILGTPVSPAGSADADVNYGVLGLDLGLGVVERVTVFARVPMIRQRIRAVIRFDDGTQDSVVDSKLTAIGDSEFGASYTISNRWDREGHPGGFRAALGGLVRLAAGLPRDPYDPLSIGTTTGQTDLAVGLVADWGSGSVGARFTAGYTVQLAATVEHRATSPVTPLDLGAQTVTVDWNPGDVVHLGVRPFFRLAQPFAVQVGLTYYRHGRDSYQSTSPGVDPSIMEEGTKRDAWVFGGGMTYSSPSAADPRAKGLPVEAYWTYEGVVASNKGVVPKVRGVRFGLRLYFGLWGM